MCRQTARTSRVPRTLHRDPRPGSRSSPLAGEQTYRSLRPAAQSRAGIRSSCCSLRLASRHNKKIVCKQAIRGKREALCRSPAAVHLHLNLVRACQQGHAGTPGCPGARVVGRKVNALRPIIEATMQHHLFRKYVRQLQRLRERARLPHRPRPSTERQRCAHVERLTLPGGQPHD